MKTKIVEESIDRKELIKIGEEGFGDLVEAVVDIEKEIMAVGGELHADEEAILLSSGSNRLHEVFCDAVLGGKEYHSRLQEMERYFFYFAFYSRKGR